MMDQLRTNSFPGCSDVSKCCWSQDEVQALVTLWANQSVQEQLLLNLRNEKVFAGLSARLASLGFNKAPNRCREKIKKLKVEYKKIKDRNYRSGTNSDYGGVWFAIMDGVLNYQPGATSHSEPMELSFAEPSLPPEAQPFFTVDTGVKTQTVWSADEVQALLKLWGDRSVQRQLRSTVRNNKIFIRLSSELASLGFYKPPNRCREKIKKLKQEYKKIKSSGGPSGRERRWFSMMESVLDPQFAAGDVPVDPSSPSNLMDSAQLSSPSCLEFDKSDKSLLWSPNEVQDVLDYQPGTLGLEPMNSAAESSMSDSLEVPNFNAGAGRERIIWSRQEVDDLVMLWADNSVQKQLLSTYRNEKIFTSLSSQLMMMGYSKTAGQCRAKIKKLKHEYRRIKDTGALSHQNSKWFIIMDDILSHQQEALPSEEADSAQTPIESTQPIWSIKVENSEVAQSGLFPEGPSVSLDSSGCDLKTSPAALGPALEDVPLEDKNHCAWLPDEVQVFLTLWAQPSIQEQLLSTVRNNKVFTYLSNQLASVGFHKTPHQCRIKVKKLKQCYKKIKCMKDSKHVDSRWFAIMDSVLDPGGENDENETNELKEVDTSAVLTHPGSPEDEPVTNNLRTIWTPDEVQILLAWWADGSIQEQLTSNLRNEKVFAQLSSELTTLGFYKTPTQCRFKIKKLKQEYKKVKYQKDSKHRTSTWFAIMDNVLGHQGQEPDTEEAAEVTDSAPKSVETSQHGFPEQVEDKGGHLSFATLSLLVPTLRLMCAFAWQVVQHCNVMHYGKVEELVRLVTELVPQLLTPEEKAQLLLRLRARLVLELCRSESTDILQVIQPHLEVIHNLTKGSSCDQEENEKLEDSESDLLEIVHTLLNDPEERKTFFKEVFPIHYGQQYEATLHSLVWKFISRLDKLLPIPDVKQTAEWLSTAPFAMEECGQLVLEPHQLKTLLHHHHRQKNMNKCYSSHTHNSVLSTLSLPPKAKPRKATSDQIKARKSKCMRYRTKPVSVRDSKDEGQSSHSREEDEAAEQKQSDDEWTPQDCSKTIEVLDLKDQQEEALASVKHSDAGDPTPLRLHTCSLCPYAHGQVAGLLQHIRKEHLVKEPGHLSPKAPETISVPQQAEIEICIPEMRRRSHTCSQCGKVFKKLSTLTRHMGTHTLPFHCDQCNKRCSCKELLIKHQRVHTGERPYKCAHCGRGFMHSATLKMHVRIHTGDRPYVCHICGKTSIQHLARHMLMHKGEKNYLCTECGKAFLSSGELRLHMRYHTGERPYTCKQCGRGFIAKCHLTIHMRSHTGERPYTCSLCPKSFPTSNLLKRHTFIHYEKKPFQCFKCGKGFAQAHTMKIHIRTRKCK